MQRKKVNAQRKRKVQIVKRPAPKPASDEVGLLGRALRGLGGLGGGMLGNMVGAPQLGASAGSSLGAAVSKWLGAGDYTVSQNSIVMKAANNIPMMHKTGQSIVVRHREFVCSLNGSTGFTVQKTLQLNPGLAASFPWLAALATRFQEYEFKGLVWHYVPTSGTFNGTTAALGSVMLQTTYRATDSGPSSKVEMLNEYCATETVPYETSAHPVECDPKENPFSVHYIRNTPITSGEPLMYDLGTTFVATQGMSTTDTVGDLWVTYEVELKKPIITSPVVTTAGYFSTTFASPTTTSFFAGAQGPVQGGLSNITFTSNTIRIAANGGATGGSYYISVTIFASGGLTHATQVSWAQPTATNGSVFLFDGVHASQTSVCTGTNPSLNNLTLISGFFNSVGENDMILTYPTAQWTSGTPGSTIVTIMKVA